MRYKVALLASTALNTVIVVRRARGGTDIAWNYAPAYRAVRDAHSRAINMEQIWI